MITKDEAVLWLSEARQELQASYEMNLPEHEVVLLLMNKKRFSDLCTARGWPIPATWSAASKDELMSTLAHIPYPCIVKPQVKNSAFRKHGPRKAFVASSERELIATYDMVSQWEKEVIVQEWIDGGDSRIAFCLTYHDREGQCLASFPGRKLRQWPVRCGNTAIAEPAPEEWRDDLVKLTQAIWKAVAFRGLGSIEYKMRPGTNAPVIMEPTVGRTNYQNEVAVINGVNIPAVAYHDMIRENYRPSVPVLRPVKLIDGAAELKAAMAYWRDGELRLLQWIKDRSGPKKYVILRANDLGPFFASVWMLVRRALRVPGRLRSLTSIFPRRREQKRLD
jgi:predicted ATP-grasp superfamily ATP-dependent carboligase